MLRSQNFLGELVHLPLGHMVSLSELKNVGGVLIEGSESLRSPSSHLNFAALAVTPEGVVVLVGIHLQLLVLGDLPFRFR